MADEQTVPEPDLGAAVTEAQRLLDHGDVAGAQRLFARTWSIVPADELELWEGLGKLAAGFDQARSGDPDAAVDSLTHGAELVGAYEPRPPHALDISGLRAWSAHLVAALDADRGAPATLAVPRLRLP